MTLPENKPSRLTYVADHRSLDFGNLTTWKLTLLENKPSRLTYMADHRSLDFGNLTTWKLWTLDLFIANLT